MLEVSQGLNILLTFIFVLTRGKYLSCKLEIIFMKVLNLFSPPSEWYTGAQSTLLNTHQYNASSGTARYSSYTGWRNISGSPSGLMLTHKGPTFLRHPVYNRSELHARKAEHKWWRTIEISKCCCALHINCSQHHIHVISLILLNLTVHVINALSLSLLATPSMLSPGDVIDALSWWRHRCSLLVTPSMLFSHDVINAIFSWLHQYFLLMTSFMVSSDDAINSLFWWRHRCSLLMTTLKGINIFLGCSRLELISGTYWQIAS